MHNDGYTIRDIAKQEHKSFRDIGTIIDREQERQETTERQTQQAYIASQAYSLFSKGKSLVEVAIELKLRQPDVQMLHGEYLKLIGFEKLHKVYEELNDGIDYFVKMYKLMKAAGINLKQVERLVAIANNELPSVEKTYESVRIRVAELHGDIRNSAFTFQSLSDGISSMNETLRSLEAKKQKEEEEISKLYQKRMKLQGFVTYFENNNEGYLHITKFAEEKVYSVLSEHKPFLRLAVQSLIKLIANDPAKYGFSIGLAREKNSEQLLDEHYNHTSAYRSVVDSSSSSHMHETAPALTKQKADGEGQKLQQEPLLLNDGLEMLVQEAGKNLFNNLVKQFAPTIIALLMLILPKSRHSLPLVPEELKAFPFQDHLQEKSQT
jgi:hypothetical protein